MLRLGLLVAGAWVAMDQLTKWWIRESVMRSEPRTIPVTRFFDIMLTHNTGVTFGLLGGSGFPPWTLALLAMVIVVVLVRLLVRAESRLAAVAYGLVIGGALGNVADRLRHGAVTDFLDFHVAGWHWPAFNMADVGVVCGAMLLFASSLQARPSGVAPGEERAGHGSRARAPGGGDERG